MATLRTADRYYATSRALARKAAREARRGDVAQVVVRHQAAAALVAEQGIAAMLAEQGMAVAPLVTPVPTAFVTDAATVTSMAAGITAQWQLDRLVESLVADAARSAESVSITSRPRVGYVRYVSPPSCSRCAILAGKFYRWSAGFLRHPGCDCTHLPTTDPRSQFLQDPRELVEQGLVTGLSKADRRALADGADLNQLVNAKDGSLRRADVGGRRVTVTSAGTTRRGLAGQRLGKGGTRLTPDSIYQLAGDDRELALSLLKQHGYVL